MKYHFILLLCLIAPLHSMVPGGSFYILGKPSGNHSETNDNQKDEINWMTMEQAIDSMQTKPKRIFVEIYTDWCHICKMMDRKTFSKARIIRNMERNYYPVRLNGEFPGPITFNDSVYTFNPGLGKGVHNLAYTLGKDAGTLSYPTVVILDENLEVVYRYPAFLSVINLEEVLDLYK